MIVLGEAEIEVLLKAPNDSEEHSLCVPYTLRRRGVETKLVLDPDIHPRQSNPDPALIRGIAKAFMWNKRLMAGDPSSLRTLARAEGVSVRYIQKLLPLAYLSPSIVGVILEGHQPRDLTLEALVNSEVPVDWKSQATMFRFLHCF